MSYRIDMWINIGNIYENPTYYPSFPELVTSRRPCASILFEKSH